MQQEDTRAVDRLDFLRIITEAEDGSVIPLLVTGNSMLPFLLNRRSVVYLEKDSDYQPKRGDIVLFLRPDGAWILHRIVRLLPNGELLINGDAQAWTETIAPQQIMAGVVRICRRKRTFSTENAFYRLLSRMWMPLRRFHPMGARVCYIWHRLPYKLFPRYMAKKNPQNQP
jgi:hypothetical protein